MIIVWAGLAVLIASSGIAWFISHEMSTANAAADRSAFARRADIEHRLYLAGDPRGVYGKYLPPREFMPEVERKPCCDSDGCLGMYDSGEHVVTPPHGSHMHIRAATEGAGRAVEAPPDKGWLTFEKVR